MKNNSGNALWFILIAIFLLGGLTVLLSRTGSNTEETGSTEKSSIYASEILKLAGGIQTAVGQLRSRGCSENQISFWHDSNGDDTENASDDYYNPNAPTDHSCHVYYPEGAGMRWTPLKNSWMDSSFSAQSLYGDVFITGESCIGNLGRTATACHTNSLPDEQLILFVPFVKQDICTAINRHLNISSIYTDDTDSYDPTKKYIGVYQDGNIINNGGNNFLGIKSMCFQGSGTPPSGSYSLYLVLFLK